MTSQAIPTFSGDLLRSLSEEVGVSGDESAVRKLILDRIRPHVTELTVDVMGNVIACRKGTGASDLRVLVSAPMDEIGFMVSDTDSDGLIHVMPVGPLDFRYLPARRVQVGAQKAPGVLIWTPIHKRAGQAATVVNADDMIVDVGASSKGGTQVSPGDRIAFQGSYLELSPTIVRGKAFDTRVGCAALIALIEGEPLPFDLHVAFTAQSKIGGRGVGIAAHRVAPQVAITLTGVAANDTPAHPDAPQMPVIRVGGGPTISAIEGRIPLAPRLRLHIEQVARTAAIPLQIDATMNPIAQAYTLSRTREGIPSAVLGVPIRYLGSPNELINLTDAEQLTALLYASLSALTLQTLAFDS